MTTDMTTDETTTLARTFIDDLDQLPAEIPGAANLEPGRLSWLHGVNAGTVKTPGVFFGKNTAFTDSPDEPWAADERYAEKGEFGYSAPELRIAFIGWRDQWFRPGADRGDLPTWLPGYEEGAKKLTEYLIRVAGLADPMVLSVSGKYKAGPIADIVSSYKRGALTQAMRKYKRTLPLWSFWLPVANKRGADLKTVYIKAQDGSGKEYGSVVTPPSLAGLPQPRTAAEILDDAALWTEYREMGWFDYKRLPQSTVEASYVVTSAPPQLPPGRNVPVPVTEGEIDLPF